MLGTDTNRDINYGEEYESIEGSVVKVIYRNEENGYAVCEVETESELIVAAGILPFLSEGEAVMIVGSWQNHAVHGRQFKAEYHEKKLPTAKKAILKYLSSGIIKGVGKTAAKRIVDQFGEETFDVIENHPDWLADIKGISLTKAQEISEEFKTQAGGKNVLMFCAGYFNAPTSVRIYKQYGAGAIEIIKSNPYALCDNVYGVDFASADKLARSLGQYETSEERIFAGIKYVLTYNSYSNGHLFVPYEKLIPAARDLLQVDQNLVARMLDRAIERKRFILRQIRNKQAVYDFQTYNTEKYCSQKLIEIDKHGKSDRVKEHEIRMRLSAIEKSERIKYSEEQIKAVLRAASTGVFILTGGPGTGKTTIIKAIIGVFSQMDRSIALAAPTGRAAKRMSQATSMEAKTIHRLLEVGYDGDEIEPVFLRNEEEPLDYDVVIIDETSMVDIFLLKSLLKAVALGTKLIFIGDADQLPSVGAGNVLRDLIRADIFATARLDTVFRQSQESLIITNAHNINAGNMPILSAKEKDFFFIRRTNGESIAQTVADLCKNRLPKTYGNDVIDKIQVITPSKKGAAGTVTLNALLQSELNPADYGKREKRFASYTMRENDKIMQIKNNYTIEWKLPDGTTGAGVYNGDIGTIKSVDSMAEIVEVEFDDNKIVEYPFESLGELAHAFAITIHKSQGSEYPIIILPISREVPKLHTRNLLYTAVTRAQIMVILISDEDCIEYMVQNNEQATRYTGLADILTEDFG